MIWERFRFGPYGHERALCRFDYQWSLPETRTRKHSRTQTFPQQKAVFVLRCSAEENTLLTHLNKVLSLIFRRYSSRKEPDWSESELSLSATMISSATRWISCFLIYFSSRIVNQIYCIYAGMRVFFSHPEPPKVQTKVLYQLLNPEKVKSEISFKADMTHHLTCGGSSSCDRWGSILQLNDTCIKSLLFLLLCFSSIKQDEKEWTAVFLLRSTSHDRWEAMELICFSSGQCVCLFTLAACAARLRSRDLRRKYAGLVSLWVSCQPQKKN